MDRPWIIFLVCIAAGIVLVMVINAHKSETLTDTPVRIPSRSEVAPPGTASQDIVRISDETRIPELMKPTETILSATKKVLSASCDKGTPNCKIQSIYDYVRLNYEYKQTSPEHRYIQSPDETLIYGSGDELELALLMASMQRAAGFENEILRGRYHTFLRVYNGNTSIMMDPGCTGCKFLDVRVSLSGREDVFR